MVHLLFVQFLSMSPLQLKRSATEKSEYILIQSCFGCYRPFLANLQRFSVVNVMHLRVFCERHILNV